MVVEGPDAVKAVRQLMGATNPLEAAPGSIRGDFALVIGENIVHGSDSTESARPRDRDLLPRRGVSRPGLEEPSIEVEGG